MINCNFLNEKERKVIQDVLFQNLAYVYVYTLEYSGGLKVCAFLQMIFEKGNSLIITTGKFADNIVLLDESDFLREKHKYNLQDDVEMKKSILSNGEEIIGEKLLHVECVQKSDEEYCCQFDFVFGKKVLHIDALIDEIDFSITLLN